MVAAREFPSLRGKRVAVIGDYVLDRHHFCEATGVAGESPLWRTLRTAATAIDNRVPVAGHLAPYMHGKSLLCTASHFRRLPRLESSRKKRRRASCREID